MIAPYICVVEIVLRRFRLWLVASSAGHPMERMLKKRVMKLSSFQWRRCTWYFRLQFCPCIVERRGVSITPMGPPRNSHSLNCGLVCPTKNIIWQPITCTNDDPGRWRICASPNRDMKSFVITLLTINPILTWFHVSLAFFSSIYYLYFTVITAGLHDQRFIRGISISASYFQSF